MNVAKIIILLGSGLFILFIGCNILSSEDDKIYNMEGIKSFDSQNEYFGIYTVDSISMNRLENFNKTMSIEIKNGKHFESINMPSCLLKNTYDFDDSIMFNSAGVYNVQRNMQDAGMDIDMRFDESDIKNIDKVEIINTTGYFYKFNNKICFVVYMGDIDGGKTLKFIKKAN